MFEDLIEKIDKDIQELEEELNRKRKLRIFYLETHKKINF